MVIVGAMEIPRRIFPHKLPVPITYWLPMQMDVQSETRRTITEPSAIDKFRNIDHGVLPQRFKRSN